MHTRSANLKSPFDIRHFSIDVVLQAHIAATVTSCTAEIIVKILAIVNIKLPSYQYSTLTLTGL